jgi:hypothetical protein
MKLDSKVYDNEESLMGHVDVVRMNFWEAVTMAEGRMTPLC